MIVKLLANKNSAPTSLGINPKTKSEIVLKKGRFGPYLQSEKKMKSLPPNTTMEEVDEQLAINLISLPKSIGQWGDNNDDIKLDIGKFGPYIRCGKVTCSIPKETPIFEVNEEQAIELLKSGKQGRGPKVIKDLTGGIEIREGRYGMYITDGKINAKMPKDLTPDELTLEEAKKLIEEKKAAPKRKFRKKK